MRICPSPKRTLPSRNWLWLLAILPFASASCRNRAELTIQDTEGRSFTLRCSDDRICSLSRAAGPGAAAPKSSDASQSARDLVKLKTAGRLVGICSPAVLEGEPSPSDCRPIVCETNASCPPAEGLSEGVCINGLCTEPSHPLVSDDAVMLCLAGTGVGPRSPAQVERLALGLNCGNPCRVPKPCRQP